MGAGACLKENVPNVEIVLADPVRSLLAAFVERCKDAESGDHMLTETRALIEEKGRTQVEGAGKMSLTDNMRHPHTGEILACVDKAVRVSDEEAFDMCRSIARESGVMVGGSSGINVCAAKQIADECASQGRGAIIVTLLCDSGLKYISKIFS